MVRNRRAVTLMPWKLFGVDASIGEGTGVYRTMVSLPTLEVYNEMGYQRSFVDREWHGWKPSSGSVRNADLKSHITAG